MECTWKTPDEGFAKINVHFVEPDHPLPIGNLNGLRVIVRDVEGAKLWSAMGPINGLNEHQAIIWGVQARVIQALNLGFDRTHIETDNREAYDIIRYQEQVVIPQNLEDSMSQFNTFFYNHFKEDMTIRRVSIIPLVMNRTAEYFTRDMGLVLPLPVAGLLPNFGKGEVFDLSPPPSPSPPSPPSVMNLDVTEGG
ncbi:hypothetical protein POM88_009375 [Heracleum sosnowskyi]|uniref:RNase H type-1 domain-containing protein n=1 Tax=Heracleum sosnowskyi TaxID=360622 RepID=A0AAD8N851_9APIA|nr:hypothetical protein POM88_009375 [Heracleum sosnowskyi]